MKIAFIVVAFLAVVSHCLALSAPPKAVNGNWEFARAVNDVDVVKLLVVMKRSQESLAKLEERFWAVSTPSPLTMNLNTHKRWTMIEGHWQ